MLNTCLKPYRPCLAYFRSRKRITPQRITYRDARKLRNLPRKIAWPFIERNGFVAVYWARPRNERNRYVCVRDGVTTISGPMPQIASIELVRRTHI